MIYDLPGLIFLTGIDVSITVCLKVNTLNPHIAKT